jgi:hypothetical protein
MAPGLLQDGIKMKNRSFDDVVDADFHVGECPRKLNTCLKSFAIGVGFGIGVAMFWYNGPELIKNFQVRQEVKTNYYDVNPMHDISLSQKGYDTLLKGFKDVGRKGGWYDARIWSNWCEILGKTDRQVYDGNVKQLLDEVNNPVSPMAKLLCKYRGPKTAPHPSQADEEQFEELCQKYEQYQPTIEALIDENHDDETTREERNRGLYKLFRQ